MNLSAIFGYDVAEAMEKNAPQPTEAKTPTKPQKSTQPKTSQAKTPTKPQKPTQPKKRSAGTIKKGRNASVSEVNLSDPETIAELINAEDSYNDWLTRGQALVDIGKSFKVSEGSVISAEFHYWTKLLSTVLDSAPASLFTDEIFGAIDENLENFASEPPASPETITPPKTSRTQKVPKTPKTPKKNCSATAYPKTTSVPNITMDGYSGRHARE